LRFIDIISKNAQISSFMKIRPVGVELFHAGRQTKLIVALRKFAKAPINNYAVEQNY